MGTSVWFLDFWTETFIKSLISMSEKFIMPLFHKTKDLIILWAILFNQNVQFVHEIVSSTKYSCLKTKELHILIFILFQCTNLEWWFKHPSLWEYRYRISTPQFLPLPIRVFSWYSLYASCIVCLINTYFIQVHFLCKLYLKKITWTSFVFIVFMNTK